MPYGAARSRHAASAMLSRAPGELVPSPTVELAAARLRSPTAPLLEEERDALVVAAVAQVAHPLELDRPVPRPDSPPAISQSMPSRSRPSSGPSSGSARDEPHRGRHLAQVVGAVRRSGGSRSTRPSRRSSGHGRSRRELGEPLVALGEDLEGVLRRRATMTSNTSRDVVVAGCPRGTGRSSSSRRSCRGRVQRSGCSSRSGQRRRSKPCS